MIKRASNGCKVHVGPSWFFFFFFFSIPLLCCLLVLSICYLLCYVLSTFFLLFADIPRLTLEVSCLPLRYTNFPYQCLEYWAYFFIVLISSMKSREWEGSSIVYSYFNNRRLVYIQINSISTSINMTIKWPKNWNTKDRRAWLTQSGTKYYVYRYNLHSVRF